MTSRRHLLASVIGFAIGAAPWAQAQDTQPATRPESRPATQPDRDSPSRSDAFARRIEHAHGIDSWQEQTAVAADIVIHFGGADMFDGSMLYDHHSGRVRMEMEDGTVMVFDGEKAWITPEREMTPGPRFHLLTWPYFLAAPFKLRDPGASLTLKASKQLLGEDFDTAQLTFAPGTGDTPDDWYVVYADPQTQRLKAMAYIVTYGTPEEEAEKEPHVAVYEGEREIDGVHLSARWMFYHWNEEQGAHGEPIGEVKLSNIRFVDPEPGRFEKPSGATEDPLPE